MADTELEASKKLIADLSKRLAALEAAGPVAGAVPGAPAAYKPSAKEPYKKVLYHGHHVAPMVMSVLDENEDGTVNIGRDGQIIVRSCPIVKQPKPGHATVGSKVPEPETVIDSDE